MVRRSQKPNETPLRLDAYIPYRLSIAANEVSQLIATAYQRRFGLSIPQWRLVAVLAECGPVVQQELVTRTAMDKMTISRAVQGLMDKALIAREVNPKDRRSNYLDLTAEGRALYAEVAPVAIAFEAALLETWSDSEIATLTFQLKRLESMAVSLAKHGLSPPSEG